MAQVKKIVILGGGAAGYIAASVLAKELLKTKLGGYEITLIESKQMGIIGVGEATIPSIQNLVRFLNIDERDFFKNTNASYKLGIAFKDWNKIGGWFFHPFGELGPDIENHPMFYYWLREKTKNPNFMPIDDISACTIAAKANKFTKPDNKIGLNWLGFAYHFDAQLVANYLEGYAKQKGVKTIDAKVNDVTLDEDGNIAALMLDNGVNVAGDFFIDCSGFAAFLIEKTLGSEFESWHKYLPVNSALAVPIQSTQPITPYTLSSAKTSGWTWRIPLQNRVGNGYVFASDFISDTDAEAELMGSLDAPNIAPPRKIKFQAGRRKKQWVKNCLSLGLASGFLEPLESTAIHLVIANIFRFMDHLPEDKNCNKLADSFNKIAIRDIEEIRDFIILHYYLSSRDDSEFWKYMRNIEIPDTLKDRIEIYKKHGRIISDYNDIFRAMSWISIYAGMEYYPDKNYGIIENIPEDFARNAINQIKGDIAQSLKNAPLHDDYIRRLVG